AQEFLGHVEAVSAGVPRPPPRALRAEGYLRHAHARGSRGERRRRAPDSLARPPNWRAARHLETALPAVVAARSRGRPRHLRDARSGRPGPEFPPNCNRAGEKTRLHSEPEVDDVTVLDDVVLALEPELPRLAAPGLAPEAHEVLVGDH